MNDRIVIRSTESRLTPILLGVFGVLMMIAGLVIALVSDNLILALVLGGIGLLMLFAGFYVEVQRVRQLMWIQLEQNRFTITDNVGERTFSDDDIVSVALQYKDNFENGNHTSTTRTFRVWIVTDADRPELIEMKGTLKLGDHDPLAPFINRVVKLLKARADDERLKNQSVLGEGWELTSKTLILRDPKKGETETSLTEIAACMAVEDKLKIWKKGEDEAYAVIPLSAANVHLLNMFLDEELGRRSENEKSEQPSGQLGRILFERKPKAGYATASLIVAGLMGLAAIIMSSIMIAGAANRNAGDVMVPLIILFSFVACLLGLVGWTMFKSLFRCHEYGVYLRTITGEKKLLFSEVESFTYSATRHYHNGAYIGTHLKLAFIPRAELNKPKLVYKTTVKNVDSSLEDMRSSIAQMIGGRMYREVKEGKSVKWNDVLTLEPAGLRYISSSMFSKNPPQTIPYSQISGQTMQQGSLSLFQRGKPKPFITSGSTTQNFYPGYAAFVALWEEARNRPVSAPAPAQDQPFPDEQPAS